MSQNSQTLPAYTPSPDPKVAELQDWPKPIVGYTGQYAAGHSTGKHSHSRHQLVHADDGVLTLWTEAGAWVVPPSYAVWVPAGIEHKVRAAAPSSMLTLYVRPESGIPVGPHCRVVSVSELVRELIRRVVSYPETYPEDGAEARLLAVLGDELSELEVAPLELPLPKDRRALAVAEQLIISPGAGLELGEWAKRVGASERTLARLFKLETGLTFGRWRQQRRLIAALEMLAGGSSVTTVAFDLGYQTPSAFVAMFRRALGVSPTRYLKEASDPTG